MGRPLDGAAVLVGSNRLVTFGGSPYVTIGRGSEAVSDAVTFPLKAGDDIAISVHVRQASGALTWHRYANTVSYITAPLAGDRTADATGVSFPTATVSWFWVDRVDQETTVPGTVVALGDSITDGWMVAPDAHQTWPDVLAERLSNAPGPERRAVVNAGIAGNMLRGPYLYGGSGQPGVLRLDHDALQLSAVSDLVVFEGTNDLASGAPAGQLIAALADIAVRAHRRGVRAFVATIIPRGLAQEGWNATREANRVAVNRWIRANAGPGRAYDGLFDFDAVVRDPRTPGSLAPEYDSGDSVHPNILGLQALADSIDLRRFA